MSYRMSREYCSNPRVDAWGVKYKCMNTYLSEETGLCKSCTPKDIDFATRDEELEFLRQHVLNLIQCQGRESVNDSMSLDYAWDMLEAYAVGR